MKKLFIKKTIIRILEKEFIFFLMLTFIFLGISTFIFYQDYLKIEKKTFFPPKKTNIYFNKESFQGLMKMIEKRENSYREIDNTSVRDIFSL